MEWITVRGEPVEPRTEERRCVRPSTSSGRTACRGAILILCLLAAGCATLAAPKEPFDVTLEVDFGPANRPAVRSVVQVERGTTLHILTAKVLPVEKGAVCCDPRETASIGGVAADPAANRWWTVSLNGSKKVSPYKTRLKPGDVVRWEYRQYEQ